MSSRIQIPRGNLSAFDPENLLEGEFFWVSRNVSTNSEDGYRSDTSAPYDEGTLYIGRPSCGQDRDVAESPIAIAGTRTYSALVYRGEVEGLDSIADDKFQFVRPGDFYIWSATASDGTKFHTQDDFIIGDMLLITDCDVDSTTGKASNIKYTKITTGGGKASLTSFNKTGTNFDATTVQDALEELEYEKLMWAGVLSSQSEVNSLRPDIGTLWLVATDDLTFTGITDTIRKGDFMVYVNSDTGWQHIPSGYTDSDLIDYNSAKAVNAMGDVTTFESSHITDVSNTSNVYQALNLLFRSKAQLDSSGKVPLSQLHDTVLGAMQYCGTWNPISTLDGVTDPAYQNAWPQGVDTDNSGEDSSSIANHAGDYYIVATDGVNIQYYDKTSAYEGDDGSIKYARDVIELNNGDWIVYSTSVIDSSGTYHWEKIDNSDRISTINFVISGDDSTGEAAHIATSYTQVKVGSPTIAASDKLVIYDGDGIMTVAGVRLVDEAVDGHDTDQDTYLPVYSGNTNTLKRSTIQNYEQNKVYLTQTHSNLYIGNDNETYNGYIYGDLYIRPHLELVESISTRTNSRLYFDVVDPTDTANSTDVVRASLNADANQIEDAEFYLPDESSKIIGKLKGVTLIKGRVTKVATTNVDNTGYIDNTSIEEHMKVTTDSQYADNGSQLYSDCDVVNIEFHAPSLSVQQTNTRSLTFGQSTLSDFNDNGGFLKGEITSQVLANESSLISTLNYLPTTSGVLINTTGLATLIFGDTGRITIFGAKQDVDGTEYCTLISSKARQLQDTLYDLLMNSASEKIDSDKSYIEAYFGTEDDKKDNYNIETDTIIGVVETGSDDTYHVKTPRSLLVTKQFVLGNGDTNMTYFIPGRTIYPDDSQYRNAYTEEELAVEDVIVEPPTKGGVLLTSNSRIDGGYYTKG